MYVCPRTCSRILCKICTCDLLCSYAVIVIYVIQLTTYVPVVYMKFDVLYVCVHNIMLGRYVGVVYKYVYIIIKYNCMYT